MDTTNRNYETLYIADAALSDEQVESIISKYSALIVDQGGEVQAAGRWDKRRLAYEIKGRREGCYILMYFTGEPAVAKELDRQFRIADDVIRHLITRVEPQHVDTSRIEQPQMVPELPAEAEEGEVLEELAAPEEVAEEPPAEAEAAPAEAEPEKVAESEAAEERAEEPSEEAAEDAAGEEPASEAGAEEPAEAGQTAEEEPAKEENEETAD